MAAFELFLVGIGLSLGQAIGVVICELFSSKQSSHDVYIGRPPGYYEHGDKEDQR